MNIIEARGLTKKYGALTAVDHVDFTIFRGECFGFLGPNGAGKTSVLGILYCFMPPSSGDVSVFNMKVTDDPGSIKSRLGVMPQDNNLDPDLSVFENLVVYARYFDIPRTVSLKRAQDLLAFVELREKSAVNIKNLSGGMQRRLLLARALINKPELIVLDEPTTGLDPHSRHSVWDQLNRLKLQGITLVLTTHYMEEAEKLCDRVAIMDSGRIIATDSPASLMNQYKGNLESVYLQLTGRNLNA